MRLHKNLAVTDAKMDELKAMKKAPLIKWIKSKNLFGGYPTSYAKEQTDIIYAKIKSWGGKKKA